MKTTTWVAGALFVVLLLLSPNNANAAPWYGPTTVTWYGPGYYGHGFACGGTYYPKARGVAVNRRFARCGARFTIRYRGRVVRVQVVDRCPGCNTSTHIFDLTARSQMDLICGRGHWCRPHTIRGRWHHGWK